MTVLLLALACDCISTPMIARWQGVGEPVQFERYVATLPDRHIVDDGCRLAYPGVYQPALVSWCTFLGASRCTLQVEAE